MEGYVDQIAGDKPREIQNFFHPCPLFLDLFYPFDCNACFERGVGLCYICRRCHFSMHVECALRPNIESNGDNEEIIQHFTHWRHPLRLVGKKDLQVGCGICEKLIYFDSASAAAYGCEECEFFVHKSCMINIPRQINNHLFHPSCPLILLTTPQYKCAACEEKHSGLVFRCGKHSFQLDVKCALTPTLDQSSKDVDRILFIGHQHPLVALRDNIIASEVDHTCGLCGEKCSLEISDEDPCFGCKRCDLFLHKSCMMNIPQQINNHLFHPSCPLILLPPQPSSYKCSGCDDEHVSNLAYSCRKCGFQLDVKCALAPTLDQSSKDADRILYIGHTHSLLALRNNNKADDDIIASEVDHGCGVCGEKCSLEILDEDPCFVCKRCDLFLHKSCMMNTPPEIINHSFHPSCPLILLKTPSSFKCAGCDDEHVSSLAYSCAKCGFQLDGKCALLPTLDQSKDADKIQHVAHKHPLQAPCDNIKDELIFLTEVDRCGVCGEKCPLESYFGCKRCQFFIHRRCAIEFTAEAEIHHPFHPLHPLTLSSTTTNSKCGSCLGSIDEFLLAYRCAKPKCNFNLHVECAMAKPQYLVKYEGHSHLLNFFDKICDATSCHICHKVARNCIIRCVACDFNIHIYCHPSAPNTIKHKCHLHPLTRTESPFQYELISSEYQEEASESDDEFYCDICEEKRDKYESVYYCAECKRIVETRCVISELLPSVTGSDSEGHGRVISAEEENSALEASIAERTIGIEKLTAKKKPLELEIEKLKALEEELKSINQELEEFERDRFLWNYELNLNKKKNNSSGASTAQGLAADLSYNYVNDEW